MPGALAVYGFLNAKLKARISGLLSPETLETLVRAPTLSEAMVLLKDTPYSALEAEYSRTGDLRGCEALLYSMEVEYHSGLERFAKEPTRSVIRAHAVRFEAETLKNAVRLWFEARVRGRPSDGSGVYLYRGPLPHRLDLDALRTAPDSAALADAVYGTPYEAVLRRTAPRAESEGTLFPLESELDRLAFSVLLASLDGLSRRDRDIARRVLGIEIDLHNVQWLARAQHFYRLGPEEALASLVPGGSSYDAAKAAAAYRSGNVSELTQALLGGRNRGLAALAGAGGDPSARLAFLERALRTVLRGESGRLLAGHPFTIGTVLAYFALRREETRTLLAILNAKYYALPEERIRNSL